MALSYKYFPPYSHRLACPPPPSPPLPYTIPAPTSRSPPASSPPPRSISGFLTAPPPALCIVSYPQATPGFTSLAAFFRKRYGGPSAGLFFVARRNFTQSLAAYSVACYLLQV